jgi:hypothetical protein
MEKRVFRNFNQRFQKIEQPKKEVNAPLITILGFAIIALVITGIFVFSSKGNEDFSGTISLKTESTNDLVSNGEKVGEVNTEIEAEVEVTVDCEDMSCFKQRFVECQYATISYELMDGLAYFYEILSLKDGLCEVKSKFIENPNPNWVGKEMVCLYDNSLEFETAIQNMNRCEGELYDLMTREY